jgi:hypothetical protein
MAASPPESVTFDPPAHRTPAEPKAVRVSAPMKNGRTVLPEIESGESVLIVTVLSFKITSESVTATD